MTPDEFRDALVSIDETQSSFARLLGLLGDPSGHKTRTVQRWATGDRDVPGPVVAMLTLLALLKARRKITTSKVRDWVTPKPGETLPVGSMPGPAVDAGESGEP